MPGDISWQPEDDAIHEEIDAQWKFLEMAKKHGVLTKIPDKKKYGLILK